MTDFLTQVRRFQEALDEMPRSKTRLFERDLDEAIVSQAPLIRDILSRSRATDRLPQHLQSLLEHLFDRWRTHTLAVKLGLAEQLLQLPDGDDPLRRVLADHPAIAAIVCSMNERSGAGFAAC